ncbi:uncharacterized protein N7518_009104 [Penicillium psychrosexuale]|uniref:uncharacterized protein n=1 Tax=Penicillium psychrosexuale TaxID=1002107 RepID=UPI0025454948|nr:uncharacterized protein N7518_009104 [Penicillium psychrosexuale]KAJ5783427.1 hypothetical protein N7518_009104 [Penicillium psychrosexuale]
MKERLVAVRWLFGGNSSYKGFYELPRSMKSPLDRLFMRGLSILSEEGFEFSNNRPFRPLNSPAQRIGEIPETGKVGYP